ncbi:alpha/beta hydrolase [Pontibacter anaerobius]|uniref:Alpha/beta hydrolase n=1 Tax=Pontibacter anaerobius TaxID=2993940 RepID=A0ABT3REX4_9BACT|nr:alpha/beta hydrolase [Pontibacter anaerobius]MCX2740408.1 alpha/beta hydrolase [Pontibacter anaerobius]
MENTMEILVKTEETRLYTVAYPNPGKETVILLHGGPGVPDGLGLVAEFLSRHFQVITFHQRGTLSSPCYNSDYSMGAYLSDIDSITARFDVQQFHLFGHSWGGLYAQIYAYQNPHRLQSLFLCSPASGTGRQWKEMLLEVSRYNKSKSTQQEWLGMIKDASLGVLGNDKAYERLFTQFCLNCNKGYNVSNPVPVMIDHIYAKPINRTSLALLREPILEPMIDQGFKFTVTYGQDDIYGDSKKYVRERYPYANYITIPQSSHFAWLQNEPAFYDILSEHYNLSS